MDVPGARALVLDTSCLSCFARAGRLDVLAALVAGRDCFAVAEVCDELTRGAAAIPALAEPLRQPWLRRAVLTEARELELLAGLARALGASGRHLGEAATLAWAGARGAVAIIDERAAVHAAKAAGIEVRGTLALVLHGARQGVLGLDSTTVLVDDLARLGGAWFPCDGATLVAWARERNLL